MPFQADTFQADTFQQGAGGTVPALAVRIDWDNDGDFLSAIESVSLSTLSKDHPLSWTRGRSADFGAEATGATSFVLRNDLEQYTPDRNWHDNPSFEDSTAGWSTLNVDPAAFQEDTFQADTFQARPVTADAGSILRVADSGGSGLWAGEAILSATLNSGVTYAIPYRFSSGVTYAVSVKLRSMSGNLNVRAGLASAGTPADIASSGANITTSWAVYTFTWTPSADRTDGVFFVRTTTAATATVRIDACQVNPGATANAYIEAPTKGQLVPGRPVHIFATHSAVDYPQFYGFIERLTPDPVNRTVAITCYDPFRRYAETDVVMAANGISRTARESRIAVLSDAERGDRNLLLNPEFATDTAIWDVGTATLTRVTSDPTYATAADLTLTSTAAPYHLRQLIRSIPQIFAGQVYRFSFMAKRVSGEVTLYFGIGESEALTMPYRIVVPDRTWRQYSVTYTAPTTRTTNHNSVPRPWIIMGTGGGTVRLTRLAFTRGQAAYPYSATGTGRWPNFVLSDGDGWRDGYRNLFPGDSNFHTNVTGWSVAGDAFVNAGTSIGLTFADSWIAPSAAQIRVESAASGAFYDLVGMTFRSGVQYTVTMAIKDVVGGGAETFHFGIGSNGTPADVSPNSSDSTTSWVHRFVQWTPSADRTDAHLFVKFSIADPNANGMIDAVQILVQDAATPSRAGYNETGPGGIGSPAQYALSSKVVKYGSASQEVVTTAAVGSGRLYDFNRIPCLFAGGQPYTAAVWLRPTIDMPYMVGMGARQSTGLWDEASVTGTALAGVWTRVVVTWTPSGASTANQAWDVVFYVYQTDAVERVVLINSARVITGAVADDDEMAQWALDGEGDIFLEAATLAGSALAALTQINGLTLARHYIAPKLVSPWYQYVTFDRNEAPVSAETVNDDLADMTLADIDRTSIVNVVPVTDATGTTYASDPASVGRYGLRLGTAIAGAAFLFGSPFQTLNTIGEVLIARYKDPRARPRITVVNRWPSQLQRELNDLITVNFGRLRIASGRYLIVRLTTTVSDAGNTWETVYQLEEQA